MLGTVSKIKSVVTQFTGPVSDDDKTVADIKIIIYNATITSVCENMSYCTTRGISKKIDTFIKPMIRQ